MNTPDIGSRKLNLNKLNSIVSTTPPKTRVLFNNTLKKSLWNRMKYWLFPYLKESERLTRQYFEAEIKQRQNITAKTEAETNLLKIKEVREFNSIINEIFSNDGLPEKAKALKLAKLLENNHKINSLYDSTHETVNQHE
ncbi:MAG: hypothetical protein JXA96_05820 [Sedimentisphaerales bacterium]|nr:hypothetical protein [Sedimentisphaerales bacterium]